MPEAVGMEHSLTTKLKLFVQFTRTKRQLDDQLKAVKHDLDQLEREIVEQMIDAGMDSTKIDGMTVYRKRRTTVKVLPHLTKEEIAEEMLQNGDGRLLGFNYPSLVSFAKEHTDEATGEVSLPEYLQGVLEVGELSELGARNS
jgi:hypothetical protein